jgi:hypothetical protein
VLIPSDPKEQAQLLHRVAFEFFPQHALRPAKDPAGALDFRDFGLIWISGDAIVAKSRYAEPPGGDLLAWPFDPDDPESIRRAVGRAMRFLFRAFEF